ncbi:DNA methyltransferase [Mycoplasmopsis columboralis]|uniref:DNA methyltransferase n=1 Tax=Mycoplasmopsis columboralis TaxID=171282 RepID=UPI0018D4F4CA|nr:DNA methyltransferase [Mycoplasmopsis columboralis]
MFQTAKPVDLIKYLIKISTKSDATILDFFADSGTTGQAVLEVNKEEKSKRTFILCQNLEQVKNNDKALEILKENNLEPTIGDITLLRLEKLKKWHNFEYKIFKEN